MMVVLLVVLNMMCWVEWVGVTVTIPAYIVHICYVILFLCIGMLLDIGHV
jgi:hypothetical protein